MRRLQLVTLLALFASAAVPARAVSIISSGSDFEPRFNYTTNSFDPGPSTTASNLRTGFQANFNLTSAYFFKLPALSPGQAITGADFAITELADTSTSAVTPGFNGDLYALGTTTVDPPANGVTESTNYYFIGSGPAPTGTVVIQDNFLVPADFIPVGGSNAVKSTNAVGDAALLAYIKTLYLNQGTNGFVPGTSSLILRMNPDAGVAAGVQRYSAASANNITPGVMLPTLTLNIVPEPSSVAILSMGLLSLALYARCKPAR
jgi:hypothetical protein